MRVRRVWMSVRRSGLVLVIGVTPARRGWAGASSKASTTSPPLEMKSATVSSVGTSLTFDVSFLDPSADAGPSSGTSASSVYGVFTLDNARGPAPEVAEPEGGLDGEFGRYVPVDQGIDAILSLTSVGSFLGHDSQSNQVDRVRDSDGTVVETVSITYGSGPGTLSFALTFSDIASIPGFAALDGVGPIPFSVVVGKVDNSADMLFPASGTVPEPTSMALIAETALALLGVRAIRARRQRRLLDRSRTMDRGAVARLA